MLPLRYLSERQKLVLLLVAVYAVSNYFAYKHLWKDGIGIRMRTLSNADALRLRSWNNEQFYATGITIERPFDESTEAEPKIAIGLGITSKKLRNVSEDNIGTKFVFFRKFLPTFCRTASKRFTYKFYLAYDSIDRLFANQRLRDAFQRQFDSVTTSGSCRERSIIVFNMSFVQCDHAGKPTWAQNDAMLEAYIDHVDYFYRVNDDTKMVTGNWTEKFISTLKSHDPPCIGVVGPNHIGGNMGIMTYDFVHRKHVDIFGFYYPRLFTDWWGDNWMTRVYKPNRSSKIRNVRLIHTMGLGQRYHTHYRVRSHLRDQLDHDITIINR